MTALAGPRKPPAKPTAISMLFQKLVKSGEKIWPGAVVARDPATGKWVEAVGTDATLEVYGIAILDGNDAFDNTDGSNADELYVSSGRFLMFASGLTDADEGKLAYVVDDQTFSLSSNSGARPVMGWVAEVVSATEAYIEIQPPGLAALLVKNVAGFVNFSLHGFREVSSGGDVGNITANGGILASDTTPIMRGDANKSAAISWAAGNADPIQAQVSLPPDFDGSAAVTIDLWVYGGTTDVCTFTVETSWDAGATVSDTATDAAASATLRKITATVAAADVPNAASNVTIQLTPAAHATDAIQLVGMRLNYQRKLCVS